MNKVCMVLATALGVLLLSACEQNDLVANPVPRAPADASVADAARDAFDDARQDALPVKRTLIRRDPFGNYAVTDNLLMDGDFEWSGPMSLQYPWFRVPMLGGQDTRPNLLFGASCHSGIRCAAFKANQGISGVAVKPSVEAKKAHLQLWLHTSKFTNPASLHVSLNGCFQFDPKVTEVALSVKQQDEDWVQVESNVVFPEGITPYCLFLTAGQDAMEGVVVDDLTLTRTDGASTRVLETRPMTRKHRELVEAWQKRARELLAGKLSKVGTPKGLPTIR